MKFIPTKSEKATYTKAKDSRITSALIIDGFFVCLIILIIYKFSPEFTFYSFLGPLSALAPIILFIVYRTLSILILGTTIGLKLFSLEILYSDFTEPTIKDKIFGSITSRPKKVNYFDTRPYVK